MQPWGFESPLSHHEYVLLGEVSNGFPEFVFLGLQVGRAVTVSLCESPVSRPRSGATCPQATPSTHQVHNDLCSGHGVQ